MLNCASEVQETIETLAQAQDGALLDCSGGYFDQDTSSDSQNSESESDQSQCPSSDNVPVQAR